jgi:phenylpropionate dioxygenase-like ring-hydroxylating dioxygenase large terminal subunit
MQTSLNSTRLYDRRDELDSIIREMLDGAGQTVETSTTLPPATYTSQAFFDFEVENIFKKDWICVGHVSQVSKIGDYFTIDLFGEMLVVVRAKDGIHVLSRVCRHRWAPVVEGEGNAVGFSCPMHGWSYALDGRLVAAPFMDKAAAFDLKDCRLPEIRSEIVEPLGLIFINFSNTGDSISERIDDLCTLLANYRMNELVYVRSDGRFLPVDKADDGPWNWKIMFSQGMECYHHFRAHPTTFAVTHPTQLSWCEESPKKGWTACYSPAADDNHEFTQILPFFPGLSEEQKKNTLCLYHIYPLTQLIVFPNRIRIKLAIPRAPDCTGRFSITLLRPEVATQVDLVKKAFATMKDYAQVVEKEDEDMRVVQQFGVRSSLAATGRLSHLEATVWHLADYVRRCTAAQGVGA